MILILNDSFLFNVVVPMEPKPHGGRYIVINKGLLMTVRNNIYARGIISQSDLSAFGESFRYAMHVHQSPIFDVLLLEIDIAAAKAKDVRRKT